MSWEAGNRAESDLKKKLKTDLIYIKKINPEKPVFTGFFMFDIGWEILLFLRNFLERKNRRRRNARKKFWEGKIGPEALAKSGFDKLGKKQMFVEIAMAVI